MEETKCNYMKDTESSLLKKNVIKFSHAEICHLFAGVELFSTWDQLYENFKDKFHQSRDADCLEKKYTEMSKLEEAVRREFKNEIEEICAKHNTKKPDETARDLRCIWSRPTKEEVEASCLCVAQVKDKADEKAEEKAEEKDEEKAEEKAEEKDEEKAEEKDEETDEEEAEEKAEEKDDEEEADLTGKIINYDVTN